VLLVLSAILVFWLQPRFGNPSVIYLLPTATLILTILSWAVTSSSKRHNWKQNLLAILILVSVAGSFWLNRFFKIELLFETSTPKPWIVVGVWMATFIGFTLLMWTKKWQKFWLVIFSSGVILALVMVKSDTLAGYLRTLINNLLNRESLDIPYQIQWLGFSYIAFRILHTFFEKKSGRLPEVSLAEYVDYIIFPGFTGRTN